MSKLRSLTIYLPWPDSALRPNARVDRRAKAAVVREHREAAAMITRAVLDGRSFVADRLSVRVVFNPPDRRRRDLDGMLSSIKSELDGVFDALGMDDQCIDRMLLVRGMEPVARGEVVVTLGDGEDWL